MKNHLFILEPKKKKSTLHPKCVFSSVMLCHEMKRGGKKAKYIMTWWRRCVDLRIILYLKVAVGAKQCQFQDITFDKNPCS